MKLRISKVEHGGYGDFYICDEDGHRMDILQCHIPIWLREEVPLTDEVQPLLEQHPELRVATKEDIIYTSDSRGYFCAILNFGDSNFYGICTTVKSPVWDMLMDALNATKPDLLAPLRKKQKEDLSPTEVALMEELDRTKVELKDLSNAHKKLLIGYKEIMEVVRGVMNDKP